MEENRNWFKIGNDIIKLKDVTCIVGPKRKYADDFFNGKQVYTCYKSKPRIVLENGSHFHATFEEAKQLLELLPATSGMTLDDCNLSEEEADKLIEILITKTNNADLSCKNCHLSPNEASEYLQ